MTDSLYSKATPLGIHLHYISRWPYTRRVKYTINVLKKRLIKTPITYIQLLSKRCKQNLYHQPKNIGGKRYPRDI